LGNKSFLLAEFLKERSRKRKRRVILLCGVQRAGKLILKQSTNCMGFAVTSVPWNIVNMHDTDCVREWAASKGAVTFSTTFSGANSEIYAPCCLFNNNESCLIFLFATESRPALGPTQPPIQWLPRALSPGVKRPGIEADHSPPSSAEAKECVKLYHHFPIRLTGVVLS